MSEHAGGDGAAYRVHLRSLQDFRDRLQDQIDLVRRSSDRLTTPAALPFGDFAEAAELTERHTAVLTEMEALMERVLAAISFAERVTDVVADEYAGSDHEVSGGYRRAAWA